jgi:hypothetical protein
VVESGGLENRYRSNPIEGSNPSLSADSGRVLKLADRRVSEARVRKDVWVQVPPRPQHDTIRRPSGRRRRFIWEVSL